jgi:hypothetical protein
VGTDAIAPRAPDLIDEVMGKSGALLSVSFVANDHENVFY